MCDHQVVLEPLKSWIAGCCSLETIRREYFFLTLFLLGEFRTSSKSGVCGCEVMSTLLLCWLATLLSSSGTSGGMSWSMPLVVAMSSSDLGTGLTDPDSFFSRILS